MEPVCVRCGWSLRAAPAMATPYGNVHVVCSAPPDATVDFLEPRWIALIYAVMLVPFVQPISFWVRRGLLLAWRERFPRRVAQLRFHGAIADAVTLSMFVVAFCAFVLWVVWHALY